MSKKLILFSNSSDNIVKLRKNLLSYICVEKYDITICIPEIKNKEIFNLKNKYRFNLLVLKSKFSALYFIFSFKVN